MTRDPNRRDRRPPWGAVMTALLSSLLLVLCVSGVSATWNARFAEIAETRREFDRAASRVVYLDEVLSMSAMTFAATGDERWLARYEEHVAPLKKEIATVRALSLELLGREIGIDTQEANDVLVQMESDAIGLARSGDTSGALAILTSTEYERQKLIYAMGHRRGNAALDAAIESEDARQAGRLKLLTTIATCLGALTVFAFGVVVSSFRRYVRAQGSDRGFISRQRAELQAILDAIPGLIYFKDDKNTILELNRAAAEAIGLPADQIRGRNTAEFFSKEDAAAYLADDCEVFASGQPKLGIREFHEPMDGERLHIQTDKIPLVGPSGELDRLVAVVTDITALTDAQNAAESASRAKGEFLANMSHEIRTPMTAILGYAEILHDDSVLKEEPERARQVIESIHDNAKHLLVLINDILDVSKIEARRLSVERVATNPVETIHEVVDLLRPSARGKGVELEVEFHSAIPEQIETDPVRFRQILLNLVGNATKFTEQGEVRLHVSCDPEDESLEVQVADTGIGMTPAQRDHIAKFGAFSQADASTTRRFGGTGLGLRISHSLAVLLGGSIQVESQWREGSTFTLTIATGDLGKTPMVDGASIRFESKGKSSGTSKSKAVKKKGLADLRILLAEDGPDNQKLVTYFLEKEGAAVVLAENGRIACELIEEAEPEALPHLVLMDMQMPELDGYGATRRLRQRGCTLPILALTANAMDGDREKCLEAGCDGFLSKPVDRRQLISACLEAVVKESART